MNKIVIGLMHGDESKGSITDYLVRKERARWGIRYSGGCQTAHRVVTEEKSHIFRQFSSGTFAGANTIFGENAVFDPYMCIREYEDLYKIGERPKMYVHENCLLTLPPHRFKCQKDAAESGHGSTGCGVWATIEDSLNKENVIRAKGLNRDSLYSLVKEIESLFLDLDVKSPSNRFSFDFIDYIVENRDVFKVVDDNWISEKLENETVVFEGNQGVLIDPEFGFFPNITANSCTQEKAVKFIHKYELGEYETVGVMRHYMTRHGAGIFPSEEKSFYIEEHNPAGKYTGPMRYGYFDKMMFDYAMKIVDPDILAITCLDQKILNDKFVETYEGMKSIPILDNWKDLADHEERTEKLNGVTPIFKNGEYHIDFPKKILSFGPTAKDKTETNSFYF